MRGGPQVRGDTGHRPVNGLHAGGRHVRVVLLHGVAHPVAQTVRRRRGPGRTVVVAVARPTAQSLPATAAAARQQRAAAGQGETPHAAAAAAAAVQRQNGGRGDAVQGQTPVGRVRGDRLHGQSADHAVRRPRRRRPVVRRVRAHDGADRGDDGRFGHRVRRQTGHGPPDQVVGRPVQQAQANARVPVRVQPGHVRAGHRRPVPPAQEHGRHTAHLQSSVVRVPGMAIICYYKKYFYYKRI